MAASFSYPPLTHREDGIRILRLEPGDFFEPLRCTLEPVPFRTRPIYVALSYTWGDPYQDNENLPITLSHSQGSENQGIDVQISLNVCMRSPYGRIMPRICRNLLTANEHIDLQRQIHSHMYLNNRIFNIGHNLYLALIHLRSLTHSLDLWVDAVCIDQSNMDERNAQVAMMSFIYTRATKVVAWLGTIGYRKRPDLFRSMGIEWKGGQGNQFAAFIAGELKNPYSLEPDSRTFARLAESNYWTRIWIVQEVALPTSLVFMYGPKIWPWEDFRSWKVLDAVKSRPMSPGIRNSIQSPRHDSVDHFDAMMQRLQTRDDKFGPAMKLETLIERFSKSACSELRDRIYGLLGLANDVYPYVEPDVPKSDAIISKASVTPQSNDGSPTKETYLRQRSKGLKVEYSCSFYTLWKRLMDFLYAQGISQESDDDSGKRRLIHRQMSIVRAAGLIQEALGQEVQKEFMSDDVNLVLNDQPIIRAVGFVCSRVLHIGASVSTMIASFQIEQEWRASWEPHYDDSNGLTVLREKNEKLLSALVRYKEEDMAKFRSIPCLTTKAFPSKATLEDFNTSSFDPREVWNDQMDHQLEANEPRLFLGTNCIIGLVPPATQVGDVIIRFWKCTAAIVMRPTNPRGTEGLQAPYTLVGRADLEDEVLLGSDSELVGHSLEHSDLKDAEMFIDCSLRTLQIITAEIVT